MTTKLLVWKKAPTVRTFGLLLLLSLTLISAATVWPQAQSQAIKVDEADALKLQVSYQQAISAQTQFENSLLRAKLKYKVPIEWMYSFESGKFEPPQPAKAETKEEKPKP